MDWISIKDGLPTKTMEDVFVACSDGDILKAFVYSDGDLGRKPRKHSA